MNDSKLNDLKNKKVKFIVCEILYDEIKEKLPSGWDENSLILEPGSKIKLEMFMNYGC